MRHNRWKGVRFRRSQTVVTLQLVLMVAVVVFAARSSYLGTSGVLAEPTIASVPATDATDTPGNGSVVSNPDPSVDAPTTTVTGTPGTGLAPTTTGSTAAPVAPPPSGRQWLDELRAQGRTFLGVATPTDSTEEVAAFAAAAQRDVDVVMVSRDWASGGFDTDAVDRVRLDGQIPLIAWEPWDHTGRGGGRLRSIQPEYALSEIIAGAHDEYIEEWAQAAASWQHPLLIRFAHEMNGFWYPWAELANDNADGEFVEAWRHVHGIFDAAGADNVAWVWSPNLDNPSLMPIEGLYPGDDFVDAVGLVGYLGNGIDPRVWAPGFEELFGPTVEIVRGLTDRPIILTEIGATELGGEKAAWITDVLTSAAADPNLIGVVWFEISKESDWRIGTSPSSQAAFADAVADDEVWGAPAPR